MCVCRWGVGHYISWLAWLHRMYEMRPRPLHKKIFSANHSRNNFSGGVKLVVIPEKILPGIWWSFPVWKLRNLPGVAHTCRLQRQPSRLFWERSNVEADPQMQLRWAKMRNLNSDNAGVETRDLKVPFDRKSLHYITLFSRINYVRCNVTVYIDNGSRINLPAM